VPRASLAPCRCSRTTATSTTKWTARSCRGRREAAGAGPGLLDIGYQGYLGFELCHPLPRVDGKLVGLEFADKNTRLAAQYARQLIAAPGRRNGGRRYVDSSSALLGHAGRTRRTAATGWAQLPGILQGNQRRVWVVKDLPRPLAAWHSLDLEQIQGRGRIVLAVRGASARASSRAGSGTLPSTSSSPTPAILCSTVFSNAAATASLPSSIRAGPPGAGARDRRAWASWASAFLRTIEVAGARYTFFDTEAQGNMSWPGLPPADGVRDRSVKVSHLGLVIRDAAPVSAYWHRSAFPKWRWPTPARADSRYHGQPLWFFVSRRPGKLCPSDLRMDHPAARSAQLLRRLSAPPRRRSAAPRLARGRPGKRHRALHEKLGYPPRPVRRLGRCWEA